VFVDEEKTKNIIDMIYLLYFLKHLPIDSINYATTQLLSGKQVDEFWDDQELLMPLTKIVYVDEHSSHINFRNILYNKYIVYLINQIKTYLTNKTHISNPLISTIKTNIRSYSLHPDLKYPSEDKRIKVDKKDIRNILTTFDNYYYQYK